MLFVPWGLPLTFTNRGRNVFRDDRDDHKSPFIPSFAGILKFGSSLLINFPETFAAMSYLHTNWRDLEVRMCKFYSLKISAGWSDPLRLNFGGAGRLYGLVDHGGES